MFIDFNPFVVLINLINQVGRPEPYNFNYDVKDDYGNNQFRREDSDDTGTVRGSYGYTDSNGLYRVVDYVADENGFRGST